VRRKKVSDQVSTGSQPNKSSRVILTALLLIGIPVLAFVAYLLIAPEATPTSTTTNTGAAIVDNDDFYDGSNVIDPPRELEDFTLTAQTGDPLSLSELRGRMVLMFFGYTHCPDFCPATLLTYRRIEEMLGENAGEVAFVFISVDGERDTPEVVAGYLVERGVADFVTGLTGDEATVQRVGTDYGLYVDILRGAETDDDYLVDHSVGSYLIDREGRMVMTYDFGTEASVIAEDIQQKLGV
jgi:protein SCO1/2